MVESVWQFEMNHRRVKKCSLVLVESFHSLHNPIIDVQRSRLYLNWHKHLQCSSLCYRQCKTKSSPFKYVLLSSYSRPPPGFSKTKFAWYSWDISADPPENRTMWGFDIHIYRRARTGPVFRIGDHVHADIGGRPCWTMWHVFVLSKTKRHVRVQTVRYPSRKGDLS